MKTTIANIKQTPTSEHTTRIDRQTKWGNPFVIGRDGTREEVIAKHQHYITQRTGTHLLKDLHELKGKILLCWCHSLPCHGNTLVELANGISKEP